MLKSVDVLVNKVCVLLGVKIEKGIVDKCVFELFFV